MTLPPRLANRSRPFSAPSRCSRSEASSPGRMAAITSPVASRGPTSRKQLVGDHISAAVGGMRPGAESLQRSDGRCRVPPISGATPVRRPPAPVGSTGSIGQTAPPSGHRLRHPATRLETVYCESSPRRCWPSRSLRRFTFRSCCGARLPRGSGWRSVSVVSSASRRSASSPLRGLPRLRRRPRPRSRAPSSDPRFGRASRRTPRS